jgi:hypothetical protein
MLCSRLGIAALALTLTFSVSAGDADRPLSHAPFDLQARQTELFRAMEQGSIEVRLVAQDSTGGHLFLKNTSPEPLTVKMPESFVGVPIHAQAFFGQPFGNPGGNNGNAASQMSSNTTGPQAVGGGTSAQNANQGSNVNNPFGNGSPFGPSFFSIPAGKTLRIPYRSVCLNHGLQDPGPRAHYTIVPTESYTDDPVLQTLIDRVGSTGVDQHVAQAAAWNIANGMSWKQLRTKWKGPIANVGGRYFSSAEITAAEELVARVQASVANPPRETHRGRTVSASSR